MDVGTAIVSAEASAIASASVTAASAPVAEPTGFISNTAYSPSVTRFFPIINRFANSSDKLRGQS